MVRIVARINVKNVLDEDKALEFDASVDTGAAYLALPRAWQPRLGGLRTIREIDCETATQELVKASVCGPVEIQVEGFEPVYGEVCFSTGIPATASSSRYWATSRSSNVRPPSTCWGTGSCT